MDAMTLLSEAHSAGLIVTTDGGKLIVRGPKAAERIAMRVLDAKPAIMVALNRVERDAVEVPAAWRKGVARMQRMTRPVAIPLDTWIALCAAARAFLASPWAGRAAALGWDALSLFGAHARAPDTRYGAKGLVWHLARGLVLVAIAADVATMRTPSGAIQHFLRDRLNAEGAVPVWDLRVAEDDDHEHHDD